jgi:peptidoglycan/xylan/chitin deacetylase (PgdA/CDA1 family)
VLQIPELADEARRHPAELGTLTWDELRAIAGDGVRVESHTLTHPHLPLLGEDELEHELRESRAAVERELDTSCRCLAYPYGEYDARVARVAREVGYHTAFALPGRLEGTDRYALPRIGIWRRDRLTRFALKTSQPVRRLSSRHPRLADRFRSPKPRPGTQAEAETTTQT